MSKTEEIARMKRQKNIIDMGLTFSAMMRVFEAGSKKTIAEKLTTNLANFSSINSKESFETFHQNFCNWFVANIKTVKKSYVQRIKQMVR